MSKAKVINWAIFILLSIIWGSSFILMKISKEELNGVQIGAIRMFSAGIVFLPFAFFHLSGIPRNKLLLVILSGLIGNLFPAFLFGIAIDNKIDSALAGILNSLTPLFVIIISIIFFQSKLPPKKIIGVVIGFVGLLFLSLSKGGITTTNFTYASLILLATFFYGLNVNIVSNYLKDVNPLKMATVSLAFMTIPASYIMWQQNVFTMVNHSAALLSIGASTLLGVVGSAVATVFFYVLIKRAGGLFASLVTYGIPIVAIFWGLIAKEEVTMIQVACLGLILGGVYVANR